MEENNKDKEMGPLAFPGSEMFEFGNLIYIILDYYDSDSDSDDKDGEGWKKGTEHDSKNIPKDVDEAIKKAFINQLKKYSK